MAATNFATNHPLAVKLWSKKLAHEVLKRTHVGNFIGSDPNALVQLKDETSKGAGDKVTIGLRMLLSGDGVQGDGTLEGQEEALTLYSDSVLIDQLRHAARSGGKMSEQRVPFSVRQECLDGLADWAADRMDTSFFNQIAGYADQTDTRYTGNNAAVEPTSTRLIAANGHDTEASLSATTTHALKLSDIDRAVTKAKTLSPQIRPIKMGGKDYWVMFIHPNVMYQLRTSNTSTVGNYVDIQKAAMQGGQIDDNPIFTGASFVYNNVIVHESTRCPVVKSTVTSSTSYRRSIICGAQAAAIAYGRENGPDRYSWVEETFDYGNQLGVAAGSIFGIKKMVFNSADFSTIVVSSYAPDA